MAKNPSLPSLTEALNSLGPKARAGAVFELLTKPSDVTAVEIDGLAGGALRAGVGVAFQQGDFQRGYAMAEKGGILEEVVREVARVPVKLDENWFYGSEEERRYRGIPEEIRNLPGFKYDLDTGIEGIITWVKGLKRLLAEKVLIPRQRYEEAVEQMRQVGGMEKKMADVALEHFSDLRAAKVVVQTGKGFSSAIKSADSHGKKRLANLLRIKHVHSLLETKVRKTDGGRVVEMRNVDDAVIYAREYFGAEEAEKTLERGISYTIADFAKEISHWNNELQSAERRNRGRLNDLEKRDNLERARTRFMRWPDDNAEKAIKLILRLPEKKQPEFRKKLYDACSTSVFDALGIARRLRDRKEILGWGMRVLWQTSVFPFEGYRQDVKAMLKSEILDNRTFEEGLIYALSLKREEAVKEAPELGVAEELLDGWITEYRKQRKGVEGEIGGPDKSYALIIGNLAKTIGKKDIAREFYIEARIFQEAAEQSDDLLDKASLLLQHTREKIDERIRFNGGHSSKPVDYYQRNRMNLEVELMNQCIELASGKEGDRTEYYTQASGVAKFLFEKGEYQEGVLFLRKAKIPAGIRASVLGGEVLESAEASQDFAGCYWLSKLKGNGEQASKYQVLAEAMKQKVHRRLEDYVWKEPKPEKKVWASDVSDDFPSF